MSSKLLQSSVACVVAAFCTSTLFATAILANVHRDSLCESLDKRDAISFLRGSSGSPYVHFFAAEAEYGAFYSMPMLAEILNQRHGFTVSVSYSLDSEGNVDSRVKDGLRGFELLEHADLLVVFTRSKYLTKSTASAFQKYLDSGRPLVGFRTANHLSLIHI